MERGDDDTERADISRGKQQQRADSSGRASGSNLNKRSNTTTYICMYCMYTAQKHIEEKKEITVKPQHKNLTTKTHTHSIPCPSIVVLVYTPLNACIARGHIRAGPAKTPAIQVEVGHAAPNFTQSEIKFKG